MVAVMYKKQPGSLSEAAKSNSFRKPLSKAMPGRCLRYALAAIAALMLSIPPAIAQQASQQSDGITIQGTVLSSDGKPVGDALIRLEQKGVLGAAETKTNAAGSFVFSAVRSGSYLLSAEKSGLRSPSTAVAASSRVERIELVLKDPVSSASIQAMTFADKPNFTVAGVTDWTAVGGHGSDTSLRTSEALATETLTLKPDSTQRNKAGLAGNPSEADKHRLAGELDEKSGDPLAAVHEFEQAVRLDPSEQNYFAWASELLLHRAVWQAEEVFQKGAEAYPQSARMLTGWGAALFAGARYDQAALRLCHASDLNPADPEPYIFMGKIQMAAPNPLACIEQKLARFVQDQPANAIANYLYAMAVLKRQQQSADKQAMQQAEALLTKAVTIDPKCADAYLQLGILAASQHQIEKAIDYYTRAIAANPQLGEAHYRLGVAYDKTGQSAKATQEFQLHDEIKKQQDEAIERQRREVKQFLVVLPQPAPAQNP
jgi:tetratricopeptide (TPR) repeat protein